MTRHLPFWDYARKAADETSATTFPENAGGLSKKVLHDLQRFCVCRQCIAEGDASYIPHHALPANLNGTALPPPCPFPESERHSATPTMPFPRIRTAQRHPPDGLPTNPNGTPLPPPRSPRQYQRHIAPHDALPPRKSQRPNATHAMPSPSITTTQYYPRNALPTSYRGTTLLTGRPPHQSSWPSAGHTTPSPRIVIRQRYPYRAPDHNGTIRPTKDPPHQSQWHITTQTMFSPPIAIIQRCPPSCLSRHSQWHISPIIIIILPRHILPNNRNETTPPKPHSPHQPQIEINTDPLHFIFLGGKENKIPIH